jgi:hypothetical protein
MPAAFERVALSGADPGAVLYSDGQRYLRGAGEDARELLASGLLDALAQAGLFPATRVLSGEVPEPLRGHFLVLEHEAIGPLSYPREWSFAMVKAAALAFLDVAEAALARGYTLKDAHLFNFVFRGMRPIWVDAGSFVPVGRLPAPVPWQDEFVRGVLVPLEMWAAGAAWLGRAAIRHPASLMGVEDVAAYRWPSLRWRFAAQARRMLGYAAVAGSIGEDSTRARLFRALFASTPQATLRKLRRRVTRLKPPPSPAWDAYQDEYLDAQGGIALPPRFERIATLVGSHAPRSVIELGGNSGVLSQALAARYPKMRVLCTDVDPAPLDRMFERKGAAALPNLSAAVLDFMVPEYTPAEIAPERRFASECVLALALTHHLLLSQGYSYDAVIDGIARYASRLAFVEFMPLGLHDGVSAPPLPAWYGLDAFRAAFERQFEVLGVQPLEENRVLLIGQAGR